jgi:glycosyltransferase involved in cell wall biosynthesis
MRIAIVSPLPPEKPGESVYTARLIKALAKDPRLEIIAIGGPSAAPLDTKVGHVKTAPIWRGRSLLYPLRLWRFIKRSRAHLVHVQFGPHGDVYGGIYGEVMLVLLLLLKCTGVKTTVTLHSTWMTEDVTERIENTPRVSKLKVMAPTIFKLYMRVLDWGTNTLQLSTAKLNSTLRERFLQEYDYREEKVLEIPHPCTRIDTIISKEKAAAKLDTTGKEVVLIFGFIRRDKGIHLAMQAIKSVCGKIPRVLLLVAGRPFDEDGEEYLQELIDLRAQLNLQENVRFDTEYIPEETVPVYYSAASIILAPYTESVGASGPLHAACGHGTPIIASNAGLHIKESLGGNVVTYDQNNVKDLSEKVTYVLEHRDLADEIGEKLVQYSTAESWDTAARRTLIYYRRTLGMEEPRKK